MPPALLDALVAEAAARRRAAGDRRRHGPVRRRCRPPAARGATADLAARFRPAGRCWWSTSPARRSRRRPWCAGFAAHDPAVASPASCSTASAASAIAAGRAMPIAALGIAGPRRDAARRQRCAARAPSRPRAGGRARRSRRAARRGSPTLAEAPSRSRRHPRRSPTPPRLGSADAATALPPPGQRIALAADAAFTFVYPHVARRLAQGRRGDRAVLAARRRGAAGRIATAAGCRAAIPSCMPGDSRRRARFRDGLARFAATRPVHGECGGYMVLGEALEDAGGVRHRDDRPARPCHQLRRAQAASRLSRGAAPCRRPARARRAHGCAATSSTTRSARSTGDDAPFAELADGARPAARH